MTEGMYEAQASGGISSNPDIGGSLSIPVVTGPEYLHALAGLGYNVENGLKPLLSDFGLIARAERSGRKSIRCHRLLRIPAGNTGVGDLCYESVGPCARTSELNEPRQARGRRVNDKRFIKSADQRQHRAERGLPAGAIGMTSAC